MKKKQTEHQVFDWKSFRSNLRIVIEDITVLTIRKKTKKKCVKKKDTSEPYQSDRLLTASQTKDRGFVGFFL